MKPPPDPLDRLLDELHPPPSAPLAPEVWRRIATADRQRAATGPTAWWAAVEAVFRQPAFSAAFVVACALLGLFLAEVRVSRLHSARDLQLAQSYLRLIDPLLAGPSPVAPKPANERKLPPL